MTVLCSSEGPVATVTLNRPEAMNSMDEPMRARFIELWDGLQRDDAIRAIVVTGAGGKAFSTGSDLKNTNPPDESYARAAFAGDGERSFVAQLRMDKPVVCAINGYALTGGLELAMACDIRIAAEHAKFGLTEVKIGSIPGGGGTQRLPRLVGMSSAMYLLLTGDMVDAAEALRIGLITEVLPAGQVLARAQAIAARIAANAPLAVRAVRELVYRGADLPLDAAIANERMAWGALRNTEDRIEGRNAFKEKRAPVYRGR